MAEALTLEALEEALGRLKAGAPDPPRGTRERPLLIVLPKMAMETLGLSEGDLVLVPAEPLSLFPAWAKVFTDTYIPLGQEPV